MKKSVKKISLLLVAICATSVFAQVPALPPVEATSVKQDTAVVAEPAKSITEGAVGIDSVKAVEPPPVAVESAIPTVEPAIPQEAVQAQVVEQVLPVPIAAKESDVKFHVGIRSGLGISALRGHKALLVPAGRAVRLEPAFSMGAGIVFAIEINSLFTIAPELQYTWYRSNGEFVLKNNTDYYRDLHEAGVSLHSFEFPILARFNFSCAYVEVGSQVGYNYYAKIYKDNELKKPELNPLALGPSFGFGANISNILVGIRGHFGLFEYAKNIKGYPWAAQVSVTQFFF